MDEKELQLLYAAMSKQFDVGDYNTFRTKMQTTEDRKKFYDAVSSKGFDLGNYDAYEQRIGGVKKKEGGGLLGAVSQIGGQAGSSKIQSGKRTAENENIQSADTKVTDYLQSLKTPVQQRNMNGFEAKEMLRRYPEQKPVQENVTVEALTPTGKVQGEITADIYNKTSKSKDEANKELLQQKAVDYDKFTEPLRRKQIASQDQSNLDAYTQLNYKPGIYLDAIKWYAKNDPVFAKQLKAAGKDINTNNPSDLIFSLPSSKMGNIVAAYLSNPDLGAFIQNERPDLYGVYSNVSDNLLKDNKDFGINVVANDVSRAIQESGYNNIDPIFNYWGKNSKEYADLVAKDIFKDNPEKLRIWNEEVKNNQEKYLDAPSFFEGFASAGKDTWSGIKNTFTEPFKSTKKSVFENMDKEASHVSANPKGIYKVIRDVGHGTGFVASIAAPGGILKGAGLSPKAASAISVGTAFFGDQLAQSRAKYPDNPVKAWASATINTAIYSALSYDLFPADKAMKLFKTVKPEIEKVTSKLTSGEITREAARQNLNTILDNAINTGKEALKINLKAASEMTAINLLNQGLDKLMMDQKEFDRFHPEGEAADTFKHMFLSNSLVAAFGGAGKVKENNRVFEEAVYDAANNPLKYQRELESVKTKNPGINESEILSNLEYISKVKKELDTLNLPEDAKKRYLAKSLIGKVATDNLDKSPDTAIQRKREENIKRIESEKDEILSGEEDLYKDDPELKKVADIVKNAEIKGFSAEPLKNAAENNPAELKSFLSEIAAQAHDPKSREVTIDTFGQEIVDAVVKMFPEGTKSTETELLTNKTKQNEPVGSNEEMGEIPARQENGQKIGSEGGVEGRPETRPEGGEENNVTGKEEKVSVIKPGENRPPEIIEPQKPKNEEPPPVTPEVKEETLKEGMSGITHSETSETRKEFGLGEEYEKTVKKDADLRAEAEGKIKKGYNIDKLLKEIKDGKQPSDVENTILKIYKAGLEAKIEKDPSEANLNELREFVKTTDVIGSETGRSLRSRQGLEPRDDSLAGFFIREIEANDYAPLTAKQKETVKKEYEDISEAEKKYQDKITKLEEENAKLRAAKVVKSDAGKRSAKKDYAAERKQIVKSINEKLKKARGDTQATVLPYAKELIAIAPDVAKLVKNLAEEGIVKLGEVVEKVYDVLKEPMPYIKERDVIDLIAGVYNEKKPTKNELAKSLYDLKVQARLTAKLEDLLNGIEPKSEQKKIQRNKEIENLKQQIKEFQKKNKEANEFYGEEITDDQKRLNAYKKRIQDKIDEIETQLKNDDFSKPEKKEEVKLDKEAKELKDRLIKLKRDREIRILKKEYENRSSKEKLLDKISEVGNIPRAVMASVDFSAPLNQAIVATAGYPKIAKKAAIQMFKSAASQKEFDRWFYDLKESPSYDLMKESGLAITDPHSPFLTAREEAFMSGYADMIGGLPGKGLSKITGKNLNFNPIRGSERAYTQYLNKMRVDIFLRFAERFAEAGKTFDNNEKLYKKLADYVNNITGRGKLGPLEKYAPVFNALFFSPKLMASRLALLNPVYFATLPAPLKKAYLKDMGKMIGIGSTILGLFSLYSLTQKDDEDKISVELDPRSSDFGKIRQKNTRWNMWGGFQPYVRMAAQLSTGQHKSTNTGYIQEYGKDARFGYTRGKAITSFFRNKLAPVPAMTWDLTSGRNSIGEKATLGKELKEHLIPLSIQDISDAWKEYGVKSLLNVGIPAAFGVGVQSYKPKLKDIQNKIKYHGKDIELPDDQFKEYKELAEKYMEEDLKKVRAFPEFKAIENDEEKITMETTVKNNAVDKAKDEIIKKYKSFFEKELPEDKAEQRRKEKRNRRIMKQLK